MRLRTIRVEAPGGAYPVHIGAGALARLPAALAAVRPSRIHLIADAAVARHHGKRVEAVLRKSGRPFTVTLVPAGERSKSARELGRLWQEVIRAGCDRDSAIVALGGGMVGDLAGFAAASVLRGIACIQLPTTLLAMVDASVGGKTGINLPEGKNLVGAFQQPRAVIMDLDFLATLPPREARSGWAEVVKTAAIRDARLFGELERGRERLAAFAPGPLARVIAACVRIKADVVRRDEREGGLRRILNFGHTLAHALEAVTGYGRLLHGEAVAIGMAFAAELGESLGRTAPGTAERLRFVLEDYGLPVSARNVRRAAPTRVLAAMARDKKQGTAGLRWVFLEHLGRAEVASGVPWERVERGVRAFLWGAPISGI